MGDTSRIGQDLGAGLLFVGFGLLGLWFGRGLDTGDAQQMGPGYAPMAISLGLVALGGWVALRGVIARSPRVEAVSPRAVLGLVAALLVFAATISTLGLVLASAATVTVACLIEPRPRWGQVLMLAAGLAAAALALFVWVLRIPFRVWPW